MSASEPGTTGRIARGLVAGAIAGAVASLAMDKFQALTKPLLPSSGEDDEQQPATVQAADAITRKLIGRDVPDIDKPMAGQVVHYTLGIALGVAYGIAAEFRPRVTAGYGSAFGVATATVLDEGVVPAVGLGAPPWQSGMAMNLYSYASHLVFGAMTELIRGQIRRVLA